MLEKWGNLVASARVTLPTDVSCSSSPAVPISAQYQDNSSDRMNKTAGIQYQFVKKIQRHEADLF